MGGGDILHGLSPRIEYHVFLRPVSRSLSLASPGKQESRGSEEHSFGRGSAGAVPSLACHQPVLTVLSQKGVLAFIVTNGDD